MAGCSATNGTSGHIRVDVIVLYIDISASSHSLTIKYVYIYIDKYSVIYTYHYTVNEHFVQRSSCPGSKICVRTILNLRKTAPGFSRLKLYIIERLVGLETIYIYIYIDKYYYIDTCDRYRLIYFRYLLLYDVLFILES